MPSQSDIDTLTNRVLLSRLRRAEGQLRGIQRMVAEDRACPEILTQLIAARRSIDQAGQALLNSHLDRCLQTLAPEDLPELRRTLDLWLRHS